MGTAAQFLQVAAHLVSRSSQVYTPDQLVHEEQQAFFFAALVPTPAQLVFAFAVRSV